MSSVRLALRRTVFLLTGGAVAIGLFILASSVYAPLQTSESGWTFLAFWVLMLIGAGLLPGVRELEVAGARDLLGVAPESVVVPHGGDGRHRWRTVLWALLHQVMGTLAGLALTIAALSIGVLVLYLRGRRSFTIPEVFSRTVPGGSAGALLVVGGVLVVVLMIVAVLLAGRAAAWSAPVLLGPTDADRLRIAEQRLLRGHEHLRLSQDLHDGVGHCLSAISLQAAAAERTSASGGDVAPALRTIRGLAADAVAELEHALTVLREEADGATRLDQQRDLRDLPELVAAYRSRGVTITGSWPTEAPDLPSIVGRIGHRVIAEGLANAAKHAPGSPVDLDVDVSERLVISVRNAMGCRTRATPTGHGLAGVREQVELVGGTLQAGPEDDGTWLLRAALPMGGRHER